MKNKHLANPVIPSNQACYQEYVKVLETKLETKEERQINTDKWLRMIAIRYPEHYPACCANIEESRK